MTSSDNHNRKPPAAQISGNSRLDAALEAKPSVQVPPDFAAKAAALATAQPLRPRRRIPQIGRSMALLLTPLVGAALFVLAPHSSPHVKNILFDTELILIAQLALIGWGISRTPATQGTRWP